LNLTLIIMFLKMALNVYSVIIILRVLFLYIVFFNMFDSSYGIIKGIEWTFDWLVDPLLHAIYIVGGEFYLSLFIFIVFLLALHNIVTYFHTK
jgi:hypothetical protein